MSINTTSISNRSFKISVYENNDSLNEIEKLELKGTVCKICAYVLYIFIITIPFINKFLDKVNQDIDERIDSFIRDNKTCIKEDFKRHSVIKIKNDDRLKSEHKLNIPENLSEVESLAFKEDAIKKTFEALDKEREERKISKKEYFMILQTLHQGVFANAVKKYLNEYKILYNRDVHCQQADNTKLEATIQFKDNSIRVISVIATKIYDIYEGQPRSLVTFKDVITTDIKSKSQIITKMDERVV
jgi:hypothetical protein